MVEVLCTLLSGGLPGMFQEETVRPLARHHFAAYNIAAFTDVDQFKATMDRMLLTLQETPPAPGHERVLYPGLPEFEEERVRRANGIPLHREVIAWFDRATAELGVAPLERM
jgi:LDH2 family malate/lactate/ureidoglycolate dehydrogenase